MPKEQYRHEFYGVYQPFAPDLCPRLIASAAGKLTIETIATESGFNSRVTFWRLFQEKYSLTPEEFKKIAGKS